MAKDSVINIRCDTETKKAIESLYGQFGITVSDAVNIFFRKSLMEGGLPFEMKQSYAAPTNFAALTDEQIDAELEKGFSDLNAGRIIPAADVANEMRRDYGI